MWRKLKNYIVILAAVVLFLYVFRSFSGSGIYNPWNDCREEGEFQMLSAPIEKLEHNSRVSVLRAESEKIIAEFYEEYGVVHVYTPDYQFLYGMTVYQFPNGVGDIAVKDETVFLESRDHTLYTFQNGGCLESVPLHEQITDPATGKAYEYVRRGKDLFFVDQNKTETIIVSFPERGVLLNKTQSVLLFLLVFGSAVFFIVIILRDSIKFSTKKTF